MSGPNSFQYSGSSGPNSFQYSGSSGPNSFQYLGISGSSGSNSFQYLGISGSSGSNSFQYLGNSGSSGQFKSNIDEVLYRFKNEKLDYFDYLKLMGIEDDLGPYIAWSKFKETPNLDAAYMLKFAEALKPTPTPTPTKERFIRENLEGTTRVDEIAANYCDIVANQGKPACTCFNSAKLFTEQDQKARNDHNIAISNWKEENRISKAEYEQKVNDTKQMRTNYIYGKNGIAMPAHRCVGKHHDLSSPDEEKYWVEYKDENTSVCTDSYDRVWWIWHKIAYQDLLLKNWDAQHKIDEWKETDQPIFTPTDINNQCCSNSIEVGSGGSVVKNVLQSCNQVIMSAQEKESAEAKKKQDEEAKKKQDEDAKKKAEEDKKKAEEDEAVLIASAAEATAKKKKMITIIAIIVGVLVFLGLGFAAYKMFFDSESGEAVAETPSANGAETPVSV